MPPKGANLLEYSEQGRDILSKFSSAPLEGFATHSVDVSISEFMKDSNTTVEKGRDYLLWHLINVEEVLQDIAENAIIDGGYDEGIDAYLVDPDEKRIRLFQSKYGSAHSIGAIDQFVQDVFRLKEKEQSKLKRDELQYLWKILNDKKMKVDLVYITDQCVDDYQNDKVRGESKYAFSKLAWYKSACRKSTPNNFALLKFAPIKLTPVKSAPDKSALLKSAFSNETCLSITPVRLHPDQSIST